MRSLTSFRGCTNERTLETRVLRKFAVDMTAAWWTGSWAAPGVDPWDHVDYAKEWYATLQWASTFCAQHNVRDPASMVHLVLRQGPSPTIAQQDIPSINEAIAQVNRLDQINRNLGHWHMFSMSESMQLTSICRICNVTRVQPSIGYLINHHHVCPAAITRRVLEERPEKHNQVGIVQPFLGLPRFIWSLQHRTWVDRLEHSLTARHAEQEPIDPDQGLQSQTIPPVCPGP